MIRPFSELEQGDPTPAGDPTLRLTREELAEVADMHRTADGCAPVLLTMFGYIAFVDGAWRPLLWQPRYVQG